MSINQRIRYLRKSVLGLNQRQFASDLGMAQTGVSGMEQEGATVTDRVIKSICLTYNINEDWLRTGLGSMQAKSDSFDLTQYILDHGCDPLEFEIVKAYFSLPKDIRQSVLDHFRKRLSSSSAPAQSVEELEEEYKKRHSASASTMDSTASSTTTDAEKAAGD